MDQNDPSNPLNPAEPSVDDLVAEYVNRLNAGEGLDADAIIGEHPSLGPEVVRQLEAFVGLGDATGPDETLGSLGDFRLRRQIGRGGMGVVYEAWERSMDRPVALKVLPAAIAADAKTLTRFVREAQVAGSLHHPNVVPVYGMGVKEKTAYYAMELVDGETLAKILARLKQSSADATTPFGSPAAQQFYFNAAEACAGVTEGLQHAHSKGVIHRDIKPANLILDRDGRLRILDFGLARLEGQEGLTVSGDFVGTPLYMSPEQARRRKIKIDHRTDVYSLGATMYELLTLRPPFQGKDPADTLSQIIESDPVEPRKINPRVPRDLETIVMKCLRKDAAERYRTAEALGQDLRRFVAGDSIEARPPTAWDLFARRVSRHRWKLLAAAGIAAFLFACSALAWRLHIEKQTSRLYLAEDYERRVVAAAMKLLRGEWVLARRSGESTESVHVLSREYQSLLGETGKLAAEEAVAELTCAIADLPDRFEGYHYRARGRRLLEDRAGAIADVKECLRRNPGFFPAKVLLVDLESAVKDRRSSVGYPAPDTGDRWGPTWLHAHQAMAREVWKEAAAAYGELHALEENSKRELFLGSSIQSLIERGVARMELKDFEGAKFDFWAARTLSQSLWGEFLEPLLLLGKAYILEGHPARAEEVYREALERSSDREKMSLWIAASYGSLVIELEHSGRSGEAVAAARKAIEFHAQDRDALLRLGWALLREHWWRRRNKASGAPEAGPDALAEVEALAAQLLARNPNDSFAFDLSSKALEAQGKLELASELAERAASLLGVGDISRRQDMSTKDLTRTAAVAAALAYGFSAEGSTQEPEGTFTDVKRLGPEVNSPYFDLVPVVSGDGLTLAFTSTRPGGSGDEDMYIADREDVDAPFTHVRNIAELNSPLWDYATFLSEDGLSLYFSSGFTHPGSSGDVDNYFSSRPSRDDPFGEPQPVGGINSEFGDYGISLTADGLEAYFNSDGRPGGKGGVDIWVATRSSTDEPFTNVRNLEEVNTVFDESVPSIAGDGLTLFWSDPLPHDPTFRPGGKGSRDIWCAKRATRQDKFGETVNLGSPINTTASDFWIRVSPRWPEDGSRVYFGRCVNCDVDADIYQATWHPAPPRFHRGDSDADGKVVLTDAVHTLLFLFQGGGELPCSDAADANDDGTVDISDAIHTLAFLFLGTATIPTPGAKFCGSDSTDDSLDCAAYGACP